jgi:hypothetical protein
MTLFRVGTRSWDWERSRRRTERVDGRTQFLAIAERQAKLAQIGIGQGWQHRRVDLLSAKEFGVFRQAYLLQPNSNVNRGLLKLGPD